jgi:hypothetical protein
MLMKIVNLIIWGLRRSSRALSLYFILDPSFLICLDIPTFSGLFHLYSLPTSSARCLSCMRAILASFFGTQASHHLSSSTRFIKLSISSWFSCGKSMSEAASPPRTGLVPGIQYLPDGLRQTHGRPPFKAYGKGSFLFYIKSIVHTYLFIAVCQILRLRHGAVDVLGQCNAAQYIRSNAISLYRLASRSLMSILV